MSLVIGEFVVVNAFRESPSEFYVLVCCFCSPGSDGKMGNSASTGGSTYDVPNRSSAKGKQPVRLEVNDLCYFPLFIQDLRLVVLSLHVVFRKRNTFMVLTGLHVLLMLLVYILIHTKL